MNPAGKLTAIVAGMVAGADSIDDLNVIRAGGMPQLSGERVPELAAALAGFPAVQGAPATGKTGRVARDTLTEWRGRGNSGRATGSGGPSMTVTCRPARIRTSSPATS